MLPENQVIETVCSRMADCERLGCNPLKNGFISVPRPCKHPEHTVSCRTAGFIVGCLRNDLRYTVSIQVDEFYPCLDHSVEKSLFRSRVTDLVAGSEESGNRLNDGCALAGSQGCCDRDPIFPVEFLRPIDKPVQ